MALAVWPQLGGASAADAPKIQALIDISCAADVRDYAVRSQALIAEFYPAINTQLHGKDHPLPFPFVAIVFEPGLAYPAFTSGNIIHAKCTTIAAMKDDYRGMIVHELAHVVQRYASRPAAAGWVVEGIADYVRHKDFERDIRPTLRIDQDGRLYGYGEAEPYNRSLQNDHVDLTRKGYLRSYTIASSFLFWLEVSKNQNIVTVLNLALTEGRYSDELFQQSCGKPLDALWAEFVAASKAHKD
jgi:hypothetical protein